MARQQMSKPALQLLAAAVLALLSVAAAQAPTPSVPKSGFRLPVTIMVSEGTPKAVQFNTQSVGGSAVYTTDLFNPVDKGNVGNMVWTGTYVTRNKVHYLLQTEITEGNYRGTLVASGIDAGGAPPKTVIVLGGTGAFEGATGTITWGAPKGSNGENLYTLDLSLLSPAARRR